MSLTKSKGISEKEIDSVLKAADKLAVCVKKLTKTNNTGNVKTFTDTVKSLDEYYAIKRKVFLGLDF